jgi:iron complex transport system substrate-binding protein
MKQLLAALLLLAGALAQPALAAGFPVAVEHSFGTVTIPAKPQRIVSIGYVEQDHLYALGLAPVAVREWFGDKPYATWPWADAARQEVNAEPAVLSGDLNMEWVLAQDPDLIVAVYQSIDQSTYDELSKVAPTIALPKGYPTWGAPWQEMLKLIDQAAWGDTTRSDAIIADLEAGYAAVRAAYPQFAGKSATNVYYSDDGSFYAYGPEDTASRFVIDLGFAFPSELGKGNPGYNQIDISAENLRLLDLDTVIWPINPGETNQQIVEAMPLYQNLRLAREGRSLWLDDGEGIFSAALSSRRRSRSAICSTSCRRCSRPPSTAIPPPCRWSRSKRRHIANRAAPGPAGVVAAAGAIRGPGRGVKAAP